jgi:hypothetical protein
MQQPQPDPLAGHKLNRTMAAIIHNLLVLLRLLQATPNLCQELIFVLKGTLYSR